MSTIEDIKCKLLLHLLLTNDEALVITNELESLQKALEAAQQRIERLEARLRRIHEFAWLEKEVSGATICTLATEALENEKA